MATMRSELVETLEDPDLVVRSTVDAEIGRIYHKWFQYTAVGSKWVRAVVYFITDSDAFVATAYVHGEVGSRGRYFGATQVSKCLVRPARRFS